MGVTNTRKATGKSSSDCFCAAFFFLLCDRRKEGRKEGRGPYVRIVRKREVLHKMPMCPFLRGMLT